MKQHTTANGETFLLADHIDTTTWSSANRRAEAYRPPANPLPADRTGRFLKISAGVLAVIASLAVITALSM